MEIYDSGGWANFCSYVDKMYDTFVQLDTELTFVNTITKREDFRSKRLPYPIQDGPRDAYEELLSTLYDPEERSKLEWAVGAIIAGDAKSIQKFMVLYGSAGSGKGTFLGIVEKLFDGYSAKFEAKALTSTSNAFSTEPFKTNPLVAIQHDGDLSRIEDNTKLNSLVSHEELVMNEKYKPMYNGRSNAFIFVGSNKPVKITDAKSGVIRRLIDVRPSGRKIAPDKYQVLVSQIDFELGAIAWHCREVYLSMGKHYFSAYKPIGMMYETDTFYNFVESNYFTFIDAEYVTLKQVYEMYKTYCQEAGLEFQMPRHKVREELKEYFDDYRDITRVDGRQLRSYYGGFQTGRFGAFGSMGAVSGDGEGKNNPAALVLEETESKLDKALSDRPAQYANDKEVPIQKWDGVSTVLKELDTSKLHYVKPESQHIVVDFDLKDETGKKSAQKNIEAASKWPKTYAEFSKGGAGIHLHYIYDGDVNKLSRVYSEGIEIKVFVGNSSLRRRLTKCNNLEVAHLSSGLPLREEKVVNKDAVKSELGLRTLIERNLHKEIHPGTKPSIDFIHKILEDAYYDGLHYDVTDMRPRILAFAMGSTNQAEYCIKLVNEMLFASEEPSESPETYLGGEDLVFFDVEVFPNLFVVCWKLKDKPFVTMINPKPEDIDRLLEFKLVGFNCRRYDNHILYARHIGYSIPQLYELSQKIIGGSSNCFFREAYKLSYTDIYDFSSELRSLKEWEIILGIHHQELGLPWDQPVPEEKWGLVAEYCGNDTIATEITFYARYQDFVARQIIAELSGLTLNHTTQQHAAKIIFGDDPRPQDKFIYTDLSEMFPGYEYKNGVSTYRGEIVGEGGEVYAEPGMYIDVALLDIESQHPRSAIELQAFGPYTKNFEALVDGRLAVKHGDLDLAAELLAGSLAGYLQNEEDIKKLAYALKIVINRVYGLTAASFDSKFKDPRNVDNIIAKRGALFMIDLKFAVQERGYVVAHIKTDSIKIPNATPEIIQFVKDFGKQYGYEFNHEATYKKLCLLNDAVYAAQDENGKWTTIGTQLIHPYVVKKLFTKEPIEFRDLCEMKKVSTALWLDMNENLPDVSEYEDILAARIAKSKDRKLTKRQQYLLDIYADMPIEVVQEQISAGHDYHFVGKAGLFCPIQPGKGGGVLCREKKEKDGYSAATGSTGYRWLEAEFVKELGKENDIDLGYHNNLVDEAYAAIGKFGDAEWFVGDYDTIPEKILMAMEPIGFGEQPPWLSPCGKDLKCEECPKVFDCDKAELPF